MAENLHYITHSSTTVKSVKSSSYSSSSVTTSVYNRVNKHQIWLSNISSVHNQPSRFQKKMDNEGTLSRQRLWANAYELSQDLREKQLELLEKKYGGSLVARRAARVIQNAYRQYSMNRNFTKLRSEADEKRLSRRFAEFSRSRTIWSDMVATVESEMTSTGLKIDKSDFDNLCSDFDAMSHSYSADNMLHYFLLQKSLKAGASLTSSQITKLKNSTASAALPATSVATVVASVSPVIQANRDFSLDVSRNTVAQKTLDEAKTRNLASEVLLINSELLSDSSGSPIGSPMEPVVDMPSACFENLMENRDEDALNDSFQSDSSQESGHLIEEDRCSDDYVMHRNHSSSSACDGCVSSRHSDETPCIVVANAEVRLRKKQSSDVISGIEGKLIAVGGADRAKTLPGISPIWRRKSLGRDCSNLEEINEGSSVTLCSSATPSSEADNVSEYQSPVEPTSHLTKSNSYQRTESLRIPQKVQSPVSDHRRKRAYRIGLNLFNKKPENGIKYLVERKFLDNRPSAIARFLIARKGLSKQMIGEYLGNLQNPFVMEVLSCFVDQIDLTSLNIDLALRKFLTYFRMPGEAQKIERLMEAFASRFGQCNQEEVGKFRSADTVFLLAFAIIMLNTDLHNSSIKPDKKMKLNDFIRNLRNIDDGHDIDPDLLTSIYENIRRFELKPGADHVSHVLKVEQMVVGNNKPQLALPHRRLVCYCRLYEVIDPSKRDKPGQHQREVFLFNDTLMVTKIFSKKKKTLMYLFRQIFSLFGMVVHIFETPHYQFGVRLSAGMDGKVLIMLNARNKQDRLKFVEDLREAIIEVNEMEALRIEEELRKQKIMQNPNNFVRYSKDSGVVDVELLKLVSDSSIYRLSAPECERLKKTTVSNSLLDIGEGNRRGSGASLDSGMASTESSSMGSCQEAGRLSRFIGLSQPGNLSSGRKSAVSPKPSPTGS